MSALPVHSDPTWQAPVVGVLGGMGPAATVSFLDLIVALTEAQRDQDHLDMVVLQHASVPDRTAALLHPEQNADPAPAIQGDLQRVADLGAAFAVILCNTAHAFLPDPLPLPVLHLINEGAAEATRRARGVAGDRPARVQVLATSGTLASGLYQRALSDSGVEVSVPEPDEQTDVMSMIYDHVKAGVPVDAAQFEAFLQRHRAGADVVLLGCTELSYLAEQHQRLDPWVVDSQRVLAKATVLRAGRSLIEATAG